jgi:gas vesicle protein
MLQDMLKDKMSSVRAGSAEEILAMLGLERRRSSIEMLVSAGALVAGGMIVGAGLGLLLAPKTGRALRREIKDKASDLVERIGDKAEEATHELRGALSHEEADKAKPNNQAKREENARPRS